MSDMEQTRQELIRHEIAAQNGMVTAMHPLAAQAGAQVLQEGGNAVDAAVTIAFAVSVVEPFMSGLGGRGGMVIHQRGKEPAGVDYTLRAPQGASNEMWPLVEPPQFVGHRSWRAVRDAANSLGYLAIGVPGTVAGLSLALERYGTITLQRALQPAIAFAEEGVEVDWFTALMIVAGARKIRQFPATAAVFFKDGLPLGPGERLVQRDLGRTLRDIAEGGPDAFYRGRFAQAIAADMAANGGLVTEADMAAYQATVHEPPLIGSYRGYEVLGTAEASGAATIVEALHILEGYDLAALGPASADTLQLMAEALRQSFSDKIAYIGDPDYVDVPLRGLTSKEYAAELRETIDLHHAQPKRPAGNPWPYEGREGEVRRWVPNPVEAEHTTALTAIDANRMAVALSQTHAPLFGSGVTIPGTGVLMSAAMQGFNPEPGWPNSVAPGKRPVWSNSPIMLRKDGEVFLCVGSPGSRRVISAELQVITNIVDFGMSVEDAVAAPRIHAELYKVFADDRIDPATIAELRARGQQVVEVRSDIGSAPVGRPSAILLDPRDGLLHGCSEPYGPGTAAGF
jgi:gamma-glutamyltranspeptidase/glutathione hydrolase